jgi:hypothetical protein
VNVTVVVDLNPALGELPEGVAVDKRGDVFFDASPLGQVRKLSRDGSVSLLAQVVPPGSGNGVAGLAVDAPGNVYVAAATRDPATSGVYKIARDGSFERLPGTGAILFPNGIALDKRGNVYVTDTIGGAVWRVPTRGAPATKWFESPLLLGTGAFNFGILLGANGIAYRQNELVVGNTERALLLRVPINPDGSASAASILAEGRHCSRSTGSRSTCTATSGPASSRRAPSSRCHRPARSRPSRPLPTDSTGRRASPLARTAICGWSTSRSGLRVGRGPGSCGSTSA